MFRNVSQIIVADIEMAHSFSSKNTFEKVPFLLVRFPPTLGDKENEQYNY
jgi:hypothetical protein